MLSVVAGGRPGARAATPTLDHLFPVAFQAGSTGTVTALGKFDPWPPKLWVDAPGITFVATTNAGRFTVQVLATAPVGPHLVRLFNEEGASGPRFLVVTREPQLEEQEPNNDFKKPQQLETLPVSINGRLERSGDVDAFQVWLEAGQTLVASLEAYVLASPVDAVLRLVDREGRQVALNHDDGRTLDPFVAFTAGSAGFHVLQVFGFAYPATSDVRFTGSASCVYRLHLSRGPHLHYTLPLGITRGRRNTLRLAGWNLGQALHQEHTFDAMGLSPDCVQTTWQPDGIENGLVLQVGGGPEEIEQEPNDEVAQARPIPAPGAVTGRISPAGDIDRYRFNAQKGAELVLEVQSAALGFPLDPWLRVEDQAGKELKKADDANGADPVLEWTAPADGDFLLAVGNLLQRGGLECLYRLSVKQPVPLARARMGINSLVLEAGTTNEVKVTVKRTHGAKGQFVAIARGLPTGTRSAEAEVPEKGGDLTLKLEAAADAKAFSGPIQILLQEKVGGQEHRVSSALVTTGVDNGVPNGYNRLLVESVDHLWLTVRPAKPAEVKVSAK